MGLYVSHNCFHGTYRAFNRWRKAVAACAGVKLDEMEGFGGDITWPGPLAPDDPILWLLAHDDDRGTIPAAACAALAVRRAGIEFMEHEGRAILNAEERAHYRLKTTD